MNTIPIFTKHSTNLFALAMGISNLIKSVTNSE